MGCLWMMSVLGGVGMVFRMMVCIVEGRGSMCLSVLYVYFMELSFVELVFV